VCSERSRQVFHCLVITISGNIEDIEVDADALPVSDGQAKAV
jgi:hypothetical protein